MLLLIQMYWLKTTFLVTIENEFDKMRCHPVVHFTTSPGEKNTANEKNHNCLEETSGCGPVKKMIFEPKRGVCSLELKIQKEGCPPTRHSST